MEKRNFDNWDLQQFFSSIVGDDFLTYLEGIKSLIELQEGKDLASLEDVADFINELEELEARLSHVICYVECVRSEDVSNVEAAKAQNSVELLEARVSKLNVTLLAKIKNLEDNEFSELCELSSLQDARYTLERMRFEAKHSMSAELENLASDLRMTGFKAWENLYESVASSLNFSIENSQGKRREVPMSLKVSLLEDRDPKVRLTTLENSNAAWMGAGETIRAALHSISGHRLKLQARRGYQHFLEEASFENGLKRSTLEAMIEAVKANVGVMRQYLRLKAKLLGVERLGFQDLYAPVDFVKGGVVHKKYTWQEAGEIIIEAFNRFDPALGAFAKRALEEHWVESEVRAGKRPGGFCAPSAILGQSRIFMTFQGNLGDVFTLAHELGHAYHENLIKDLRYFNHSYPMTLAETASTFAETLLGDYLLSQEGMGRIEKLEMYKRRLDDASAYLLNILMRYLFEVSFYEARQRDEVFSVAELNELMEKTQIQVYDDALDPQRLDPLFWASKGHFYITEVSFYNFPYIFGYLFSLGVYARFKLEGEPFRKTFVELLRLTGRASCEDVAKKSLNVDLEKIAFWQESINLVAGDLKKFEELLAMC